jgi:hypothetical protein
MDRKEAETGRDLLKEAQLARPRRYPCGIKKAPHFMRGSLLTGGSV